MKFEQAHEIFFEDHVKRRSGKRLYHLKKGHDHAEKEFLKNVWWGAFGNFDLLHPQYEVYDFKDGMRYLDFAYIAELFRICFEIDGYGPHWQNMSRQDFSDDRMRQNHLILDGWIVIRFSYDHIVKHPRECQQIIQQMLGKLSGTRLMSGLNHFQHEIIRYGISKNGIIKLREVCTHLEVSEKKSRKLLKDMVEKQLLAPIGGPKRIHSYQIVNKNIRRFY